MWRKKDNLEMRIPHTIPRNVFEAYRCSYETTRLSSELERTIRSEDVSWVEGRVPPLRILATYVIASSWKDNPVLEELPTCEDRNRLIEILPTDLPFELAITRIDDEHYWERCSKARWEVNDLSEHGNSWRQRYCEGLLWEYLEGLEPTFFEAQKEECEKMLKLVQNYVDALRIGSLLPTKKVEKSLDNGDPCLAEEDIVHHVPMAVILSQLPLLVEIRIVFGVVYMNDNFEWRDFEFSIEDCIGLGEGIKACSNLKKFTLSRSNMNQPRVAALLQGAVENENIEEMDFSHCKLSDKGAHAVGEFLSMHKGLKVLHLANNDIGPDGVAGVVYGLLKADGSVLKHLDLRLNPLLDSGMVHVCAYVLRTSSLEMLNVSGCGIKADGAAALAEVLQSGCVKFKTLILDVSNNDFGEAVGEIFEAALNSASFIVHLDARMCNFSSRSELSIYESVARHKEEQRREKAKTMLDRLSTHTHSTYTYR
ncbi:dynein regulatory complex subunit 5 isoform X1 [Hylaeus volcanicus]|uniref:dynein regulatory complex subunit 5 isoform X1 n=2 Tax=Hylaeus volcanicus TaxID=313075 RepID=UPI0023B87503|nr:dynein regulatory complex subunit 5 isoform X1 [Hylaeus volcanicus]